MFNEIEKKIVDLEGVFSCKITGEKEIDEIHLVAAKEREPKKIVRDIETVVLIEQGKEISHKKISIAQIKNNKTNTENNANRIEIISIYNENNNPVYHYKLSINNNIVEETLKGNFENMLPIKIAEGLIKIIHKYTNFQGKVIIEHSFVTGLNNEIIIVQLTLYNDENTSSGERLLGASYINHNLPLATGKACLKALNRRLNF